MRCSNYGTNRIRDVQIEVMSSHKWAFNIFLEDGPIREHNALNPLMNEHNYEQELIVYHYGN